MLLMNTSDCTRRWGRRTVSANAFHSFIWAFTLLYPHHQGCFLDLLFSRNTLEPECQSANEQKKFHTFSLMAVS